MRARTLKQVAAAFLISTASAVAFLLENRGAKTVVAERSEPVASPATARRDLIAVLRKLIIVYSSTLRSSAYRFGRRPGLS
jgi:hypothetical protein